MGTIDTLRKPVASQRALRQRNKTLTLGILLAAGIAGVLAMLLFGCGGNSTPVVPPPIPAVQALQAADVQSIGTAAGNSGNGDMGVAVGDRAGFLLGVVRTRNGPVKTEAN